MLTLDQVARLSGVSRTTVSRVINNSPHVRPATRDKVWRVIQETGFQPNLVARSLAAGRTRMIGLLIPRPVTNLFNDPYFSVVIQAVASACNAHDYSVTLWLAEPTFERHMARRLLNQTLVDGVIVSSAQLDDPVLHALIDSKRPCVVIGRHAASDCLSYIDVDNRGGAFAAVRHLIDLGRQRIALISGPRNTAPGLDRHEGYREALAQAGLPYDSALAEESDFTYEGGCQAMRRLLNQHPDAVFAGGDILAVAALHVIHGAGLKVPEQVAVVGFDDLGLAVSARPPLTTIRQPVHQSGSLAVETLIDLIDHPEHKPRHLVLPTELIVRTSCGARCAQVSDVNCRSTGLETA
ncbi:MAG: LacI family DNA-binding transcriptional regulator [Anaerolineae bacterium]|nr:LacI family transcriptional regulator [Thermoflexales bacterium]MDW8408702.1 LacI family DNA-binding transcriptional regulator [Anaerolineae bacterium]